MVNATYDASGDLYSSTGTIFNMGDIAWTLASTALVWIMIPGNVLNMIYLSMMTVAMVFFQVQYFALRNVLNQPSIGSPRVPAIVFCVFQLMFAAITYVMISMVSYSEHSCNSSPMIALGAIAERSRLGPLLAFVFIWSTLVYDPIACWTWNSQGWSYVLGGLDFAGGTPVHISSGTAALAISLYLGKRRGYGTERLAYKPHNTTYVILGMVFLWFGFNGGSALSANLRATQACIVTNLAASVGGLTWMLWDYRLERKWSVVSFCSGAIAGLVAITPGSGFVGSPAAVLFGFMAGTVCNFATQLKFIFKYDDTLDIFASHAIGGIAGNVLTGLFAQASIASADGVVTIPGGWLDQNYRQLGIQLADSVSGLSYSFVMTTIILWVMHFIPGLRIRCDEETEILGVDDAEMGEFAYDYVALENEVMPRSEYNAASSGSREPQHTTATTSQISEEKQIGEEDVSRVQ
ncbi:ammonium transporter AmtB-like domain-containing protein [Suillus discolor]|uniref:Ammonium transporter AmtB-like domain-containing protein n=1 Tax=Suillus discolor TaxID=1912936 RepID=A0A9P7JNE6_9AGAM|nr:ammonium transporter AmtB-like domain-containing protein [Suillus discolor]KAG2092317.1 ammonium transporter AmtB-like domain-containing protein [Suillus discolor]